MPVGSPSAPTHIVQRMGALRRSRRGARLAILDLGVGFGFYGAAVRNFLDLGVRPFRHYLVGIEGHEPYRNPCWALYDRLDVGRIQDISFIELLPRARTGWDIIIMSDVLEHFEHEEGVKQLERAKRALAPGGELIISTPGDPAKQGAVHGNELEIHRSAFISKDLEPLGFEMIRREGMGSDGRNTVIAVHVRKKS